MLLTPKHAPKLTQIFKKKFCTSFLNIENVTLQVTFCLSFEDSLKILRNAVWSDEQTWERGRMPRGRRWMEKWEGRSLLSTGAQEVVQPGGAQG